jgi:UDP-N-acetylmuramate--alanine ligase
MVAAIELDVDLGQAIEGLKHFTGVRRRFEVKGKWNEATIVDDYGHHPTEIAATLASARGFWKGRVLVAFQPHRYTRTQICWNQFGEALKPADEVFLLDVYPAGELPIKGIESRELVKTVSSCEYVGGLEQARMRISERLKPGDMLITLGAGNITQLGSLILNQN